MPKRQGGVPNPIADQRKRDAEKAMAERQAESDTVNENMERLRAQRREREAAGADKQK
jgi:hypothetical protein